MTQLSFQYRAINASGAMARGIVQARDQHEAYRQLVATGFKPIRINQQRRLGFGLGKKKVTRKDLAHFTRQFAVLMEARIPIVDGLRSLADQEQNQRLRDVVSDVAESISAGNTLTDSLNPHRNVFGDVYVETVRAAETSGNIVEVLNNLADRKSVV